jgi:ketosteroid isomerase-like protein
LQQWAAATRKGQRDEVLANYLPDVLIYDVLTPMKYRGAAAYRQSWDEWQPDTQGEGQFELQDLSVNQRVIIAQNNRVGVTGSRTG